MLSDKERDRPSAGGIEGDSAQVTKQASVWISRHRGQWNESARELGTDKINFF